MIMIKIKKPVITTVNEITKKVADEFVEQVTGVTSTRSSSRM